MSLVPYLHIARPDHWFKNIFVLPGILLAVYFYPSLWTTSSAIPIVVGFIAVCLTASSNYVLNEILDAERDKSHPVKKDRPIPSGQVVIRLAYAEWILLGIAGVGAGWWISTPLGLSCLLLWIMGTIYNIPPVRTKDLPYLDVLTESINNPLRMLIGWYSTGLDITPPISVLLAYWMFGAFLMATKRFAEYRVIGCRLKAAKYRSSFAHYTEERLLESIIFYVALFAMFSAIFMTRYKIELILATPIVAYAIAYYLHLGFKPDSPVQYPERLHKQKKLMIIVTIAFAVCVSLLFADIPALDKIWIASTGP
ncbi:MAG: prenyltransferase [Verrucomicrobia bacterium]|nr:prenyltransferase [Verrucomicrobiota bacterium]